MRMLLAGLVLALLAVQPVRAQEEVEATYKAHCVTCHGADGSGAGHEKMKIKPADLRSEEVQKLSDEELFKTIAYGVGHKQYPHVFAEHGVSQKQVSELVVYIRKFAKLAKK